MTKQSLSLLIASFLLLPTLSTAAQSQPAIKKLAAAEAAALEKKLDRRLLPPDSDQMEFQPDQAVSITGSSPLKLMPVRFKSPNPGGGTAPHFQCGLYLIAENHPATFLSTFGTDWTEAESCDGLNAIGLVNLTGTPQSGASGYPDVVLIYEAYTVPESFPEPVLLTWDARMGTYHPDAEQSQWLGQQKDGHTIPGARRLLASRFHGRPAT